MIEWWGWVLIWLGLVLALIAMLGVFAWWLFRKFLVLLDDVANLADRGAILDPAELRLVKPQLAVLAEVSAVRDRENARRAHRAARRRTKHEKRLARATAIGSVRVSDVTWPKDWYGS